MALKVKVGGVAYGITPSSLEVKSILGGRATAKFSMRGALAGLTIFTKGQEVIIYDDAVNDTVLVSNVFGPYGAPGLLWTIDNAGIAIVDNVDLPVNDADAGTVEFIGMINSGLEIIEGLLKMTGVGSRIFSLRGYDNVNAYISTILDVSIRYDTVDEGLIFRATCSTDSASDTISTVVADLPITDGTPYRFTISWDYAGGSTTFILYINGVYVDSVIVFGRPFFHGPIPPLPTYIGWHIEHDTQPMVESYISDVRLWEDVRTAGEADTYKYSYLVGDEAGLIGYWKCDEGTGIVLDDETVGANDGRLEIGYSGTYPRWGVAVKDWSGTFDGVGTYEYQTFDWRHFCGRILEPKLEKIAPNVYQQNVECADYSSRFDDGLALGDMIDINCSKVIQYYIPRLFEDDEIGCRTISPGPTIARVRYYFTSMKKVLDELTKGADYIWNVDPYKELRFGPRTKVKAPFDIDDGAPTLLYTEITREDVKGRYYNKLYARAKTKDPTTGDEITSLFMIQDNDEIAARALAEGSSGVYEHFEDLPAVRNNEHAVWLLSGMLEEAVSSGTDVTYITRSPGLRVGVLQHITNVTLDIDSDFIIKQIIYKLEGGSDPRYEVVATSTKKSARLDDMLDNAIEAKSNFREPGIETYLPVGAIGETEDIEMSDSLVITHGAI